MVCFPRSPLCLVWKEHDIVLLLQHLDPANLGVQHPSTRIKNLQAVVVTPDEKAVVFIRSKTKLKWGGLPQSESKISAAKIITVGLYRYIGGISPEQTLVNYLKKPDTCNVVTEEVRNSDTLVRILIAHSNGNFETITLDLSSIVLPS